MKSIIPALFVLSFLAWSCKKSDNSPPVVATDPGGKLDSEYVYEGNTEAHGATRVAYSYDEAGRITGIHFNETDTSVSNGSIIPYVYQAFFTYTGDDSLPSAWSESFGPDHPSTEDHAFTYAGGLLTRDSINSGSDVVFTDFTYGQDITYAKGNTGEADTLVYSGGNLVRLGHSFNGSDYSYGLYTYGTETDPTYIPAWKAATPSFALSGLQDFGSPNLAQSLRSYVDGNLDIEVDYVWTTNAAGRVISGVGTDKSTGKPVQTFVFVYKKTM